MIKSIIEYIMKNPWTLEQSPWRDQFLPSPQPLLQSPPSIPLELNIDHPTPQHTNPIRINIWICTIISIQIQILCISSRDNLNNLEPLSIMRSSNSSTQVIFLNLKEKIIDLTTLSHKLMTYILYVHPVAQSFSLITHPSPFIHNNFRHVIVIIAHNMTPFQTRNLHQIHLTHNRMVDESSSSNINLMRLIQWNFHGDANREFRVTFQDQLNTHNPSIFILIETKLSGDFFLDVASELGFPKYTFTDSEGL